MTDFAAEAAPLTRRQAREIERRTGTRPLAIAPTAVPPSRPAWTDLRFVPAAPPQPATAVARREDTGRIERNAVRALLAVAPTEVLDPRPARRADAAPATAFVRHAPTQGPAGRGRTVRAPKPAAVIARGRRRAAGGVAASASAVAAVAVGVLLPMQQADLESIQHSADVAAAVPPTATPQAAPTEAPAAPVATATAAPALPEVAAPDEAESRGEYTVVEFTADAVVETVPPPPPPTATPSPDGASTTGDVDAAGHESGAVTGGWAAPIDSSGITDYYGPRWGRMHNGIDLNASIGSPLYAVGSGTVTFAGPQGSYGNHIEITLDDGTVVTYSHLSSIGASVGQSVAPGEYIGAAGNTGNSTGPHLHFEVRIGGSFTDPLPWLADRGITYRSLV